MTREEFEDLVARLEQTAPNNMTSYRMKVVLLALAGYGYILGVLAVLFAVIGLLVASVGVRGGGLYLISLLLVTGTLTVVVLRALWVRWPKPQGIPLHREQLPELFSQVESIQQRVKAPRVHRIFLNDSFNAAMEQRPRLGILGWPEGIMHLGLPLMQSLSVEEFRAVIAHELGHLSGNHGRTAGWVYRIRSTWMKLVQNHAESDNGVILHFLRFFDWYAPFLNAYSFVLARGNEYEADRCAAAVAGPETMASALVNMSVRGKFLSENFWPGLWGMAEQTTEPPVNTFHRQAVAMRGPVVADHGLRWLMQAFAEETGHADTHPCLRDRLSALQVTLSEQEWMAKLEKPVFPSAAEALFGSALDHYRGVLDKEWVSAAKPGWKTRHEEIRQFRTRIAELEKKQSESGLEEVESFELARLRNDLDGDDVAVSLYRRIVESNPGHVSALFHLGRILLNNGDADGIRYLNAAMAADVDCTPNATFLIEQFLRVHGSPDEAEKYRQRALKYDDLSEEAKKERTTITANDHFEPHSLELDVRQAIRNEMRQYKHLKAAYLVRKHVKVFPDRPAFVLGIVPTGMFLSRKVREADGILLEQIAQCGTLPEGTYIILLNANQRALTKKLKGVSDSQIVGT